MANYFNQTILNYTTQTIQDDGTIVMDYKSIDKMNFMNYAFIVCDQTFFAYKYLKENDNLQKVSLDLYGTSNYWDILLLLNEYNPLLDTVFDYDTIMSSSEDLSNSYNSEFFNNNLSNKVLTQMQNSYSENLKTINENNRILRYVKPENISEFISNGRSRGYF
jgi:hypothetical protein